MAHWYWAENGTRNGPCEARTLKQLASAGRVQPHTLVWKTGLPDWVAASTVNGLFEPGQVPLTPASGAEASPGRRTEPPALAGIAIASAREHAATILSDLRALNFREEVVPIDESNLRTLMRDFVFWGVTLLGVVPLLIVTIEDPKQQLTAFALFFAVLWGVVFKYFIVRVSGEWPILIGSLFATGVVGIYVLLAIYEHLLPAVYLDLAFSEKSMVSLIGFIVQVGVCEELCKCAPIVAYLFLKRQAARPMTAVLVGVFSGLGFAAFENMHYGEQSVMRSLQLADMYGFEGVVAGVQSAMVIVMLRSLSLVFCHAVWSGIVAYFLAMASVSGKRWGALFITGLAVSAVLHGVYDWLASVQQTMAALVAAVSFVLFYAYMAKLRALTEAGGGSEEAPELPPDVTAAPATEPA